MMRYWLRVVCAFVLLKAANSVMREAEQLLAQNMDAKEDIIAPSLAVIDGDEVQADEDAATVAVEINHG